MYLPRGAREGPGQRTGRRVGRGEGDGHSLAGRGAVGVTGHDHQFDHRKALLDRLHKFASLASSKN